MDWTYLNRGVYELCFNDRITKSLMQMLLPHLGPAEPHHDSGPH